MKMYSLLLIAVIGSIPALATASVQHEEEIVCERQLPSGAADQGMTLTIKGNSFDWAKLATIQENGYVGPREFAHYSVALLPKVRKTNAGVILRYTGLEKGTFELTVLAKQSSKGAQLSGPGKLVFKHEGSVYAMKVQCRERKPLTPAPF